MADTWKFVRTGCKVVDERGRKIAVVSVAHCGEDELMARGSAIAAAPRLQALNAELVVALEGALEVMQFAYMNAPKQPKEIAQARATLKKAQSQ